MTGSTVGSWSFDFNKRLFFGTNETYEIFGRTQNEFDGSLENVLAFLVEEDRDAFVKGMEDAYRGIPLNIRFKILTAAGELKHIHARAEMFYREDQTPDVMMGTVQDVTGQLLLESDIKNLYVNFKADEIGLSSGEFYYDAHSNRFIMGEEVYRLFNLSKENFDGTVESIFKIIHPDDLKQFENIFSNAEESRGFDLVFRVINLQGELRHVHCEGNIHAEGTEIQWISGNIEDITKFVLLKQETDQKLMEIQRAQMSFLVGSWEFDLESEKFNWSDVTYEIYGLDPNGGPPDFKTFISKVYPEDRSQVLALLAENPEENPFEFEFRIMRSEGDIRHIKHLVEVIHDEGGTPKTIRGNIQDITHQKEMEEKIKTSIDALNLMKKRFDLMVDRAEDVFEIIDETGFIKYISPTVESMVGIGRNVLEGHFIWDFLEGDEKTVVKKLFDRCLKEPDVMHVGNTKFTQKNGDVIHLEVSMNNHLADPEVGGIVLNWKDITTKVNLDKKVHQLANFDELTGLPNRTHFKAKLAENIYAYSAKNGKFAVFMIDIDEFKGINNALSFEFGDHVIQKIGTEIMKTLSHKEVFVSRFYGDQFGVIVDGISDIVEGQAIAECILSIFDRSFIIDQYELFVTASIGFSIYPDDHRDGNVLIKYANIALSRAKDMGKERYHAYSPMLDIKSFKDFSLRNDFKKAIENDELEVHFQPIVNLKTSQIIAAEALTRWNHPEWGMVPPMEFIPIAESTGLIIPMGKWLLEAVCRYYKEWLNQGLPQIKISVNYSALQFYQVNFVNEILETIESFGLDPDFMILEITESVLINQGKQTKRDLMELKKHGIQVAIDDFGTGYSSLTYLSSMNVDVLKIDRAFIDDLSNSEKSAKILIAIINLAKDLNMRLVAEGVSEWAHLDFLTLHNCFAGQGYLFSKPLSSDRFLKILRKGYIEPVSEEAVEIKPEDEQRHSERILMDQLLESDMTIVEIKGKPVKVGRTKAQIRDIGLCGMSFMTTVKFPVKKDIVLQFDFKINDISAEVKGTVIWTEEIEPGKHLFGFEFLQAESNMDQVDSIITALQDKGEQKESFNSILEQIEKSGKLPKIPEGLYEILELLYDPSELDIEVLAEKVGVCGELNTLVLENINSGYFNIYKKVVSIEEAIILLGMKTVLNLIVFFITRLLFDLDLDRKDRRFDIYHYWRHVLGTSIAAQMISQKLNKGDKHMLFTYGLIHDIGIPVLDNCLPDHLDQISDKVMNGTHQIVAEKVVLGGLTHSDIGAWLCRKWHFREDITDIVLHHHTPLLSELESIDTMIMYVADVMSIDNNERLIGLATDYGVSEKVLDLIGLTREAYDEIASSLSKEIEKVGTYFVL
jgi:diguanylate cyclase (GGDEF)-like protein/PAS domain S-box-containing protein